MGEPVNLQDFIRQRLVNEGGGSLQIVRLPDGRFQANVQRGRDSAFSHEVHDDPVDALWNALVPFPMRRPGANGPPFQQTLNPPSLGVNRDVERADQIDLEETIALALAASDPLEDVLG
jgi:hypothetical protein